MRIQKPAVAGDFYPEEPARLAKIVAKLIDVNEGPEIDQPKALILPHAGMRYSGRVAASGVARLRNDGTAAIERVVILGPAHHLSFEGIALPAADALETPLGTVPVDPTASVLSELHDVNVIPEAFEREHSIEVELPLLQERLGEFSVLPLLIGDISRERLETILEAVWGGSETLIVISTDLSHFLDAEACQALDDATAKQIERVGGAAIGAEGACGYRPLMAFLGLAERKGLKLTRLRLSHSGRVTGDQSRVVGYGAWMAHAPGKMTISTPLRVEALRTARQALLSRQNRGKEPAVNLATFSPVMHSLGASFVTLTLEGKLRGCIGSLEARHPLIEDIVANAIKAGFNDPRFEPVNRNDIMMSRLEIAVLSRPQPLEFEEEAEIYEQIVPGRDGMIFEDGPHRGTFLPKVWDHFEAPQEFVRALKRKAGVSEEHWSKNVKVSRFTTETFSETESMARELN